MPTRTTIGLVTLSLLVTSAPAWAQAPAPGHVHPSPPATTQPQPPGAPPGPGMLIGYLAAASAAIGIVFGLNHFELDLWLPALTAVSAIFFGAGYMLGRNDRGKTWSTMLISSGLALGTIVSLVAFFILKPGGGGYALVIAALFTVELFTRRNAWLEWFIETLVSIALILVLNDFNVREVAYYMSGVSLVWLAGDALLHLTFKERFLPALTWLACGALTFAAVRCVSPPLVVAPILIVRTGSRDRPRAVSRLERNRTESTPWSDATPRTCRMIVNQVVVAFCERYQQPSLKHSAGHRPYSGRSLAALQG